MVRARLDKAKRAPATVATVTPEAEAAATFIPPGMAGGIGPVPDASTI